MDNGYTGKELAEMIFELKIELGKTTDLIKKYNGLRENQIEFENRLTALETLYKEKQSTKKDYQWLVGILVGIVLSFLTKFI